jgi:ethanolamine utilization protein EutM
MSAKALGLIEAIGLTSAIEAADAAAKAANITLLGYENTKGGGLITVKFVGDVGAVHAAVAAGSAAAMRVGKVAACLVIPRPHAEIEALVAQVTRGRAHQPASTPEPSAVAPEPSTSTDEAPAGTDEAPAGTPEPSNNTDEAPAGTDEAPADGSGHSKGRNATPRRSKSTTKSDALSNSDAGEIEG